MKLLHIAPIGHHAEGLGSVLKELVPWQLKAGAEVRIISIYANRIYDNLPIEHLTERSAFSKYIDVWQPDFVLFHAIYEMPYIGFCKELLKRNIPYGIQLHGALSEENYRKNHFKKVVANFLLFNRFIRKAKSIIYLSEAEYERCIVKRINPNKTIIPNGAIPRQVDWSLPLPMERIEVIFVGRISLYVKGLDKLLEALPYLEHRDEVHFSIYGNEDDLHTEQLKAQIVGKEALVEYRGGLYGEQKDATLRKANLFILTSPSEGMPMGLLEALAYGIPCIVTPGTNMAKVVQETQSGWVAQYDARDIAQTIDRAIAEYRENPSRYRANAYELSKRYSWESISKSSIQLLEHLSNINP